MKQIEVSVILPVLDEVDSLGVLHRELTETLERLGRSYEILFIDDGSRDGQHRGRHECRSGGLGLGRQFVWRVWKPDVFPDQRSSDGSRSGP